MFKRKTTLSNVKVIEKKYNEPRYYYQFPFKAWAFFYHIWETYAQVNGSFLLLLKSCIAADFEWTNKS